MLDNIKQTAEKFVERHLPSCRWGIPVTISKNTLNNVRDNLKKLLRETYKRGHDDGTMHRKIAVCGVDIDTIFEILNWCDEQNIPIESLTRRFDDYREAGRAQGRKIDDLNARLHDKDIAIEGLNAALVEAEDTPKVQINEAPRAQIIDSHVNEVHVHEDDEVEVIVTKGPGRFVRRTFRGTRPRDPNDWLRGLRRG